MRRRTYIGARSVTTHGLSQLNHRELRRYDEMLHLKNKEIIMLFQNQNPSKICMHVIFLSIECTSVVNIWKLFFKRPAKIPSNATEHMHMNQLNI